MKKLAVQLIKELTTLSDTIPAGFKGLFAKSSGLFWKNSDGTEKQIATADQIPTSLPANGGNSDTVDGYHAANLVKYADPIMPTNNFGGKPLYLNSIDNAMYAADKKWWVLATTHLKSYGGNTYPLLNPAWVSIYSTTGSGTVFNVVTSPADIVVYNNDTLCALVTTPTNQYQYTYVGGVLTFGSTVTGTLYVYPGPSLTQYLDSPVQTSTTTPGCFNGSYEEGFDIPVGYYGKIKVISNDIGTANIPGNYPYGTLYLSYYYNLTPDSAYVRIYNRNYRPHTIGWHQNVFTDYNGTNAGTAYIQKVMPDSTYGRTIMEFIILSQASHATKLTEIDWQLDRPNLSENGSTVTKYGVNKLYYALEFWQQLTKRIGLNPDGSATFDKTVQSNEIINFDANIEPTQTGASVTKTSTWMWQYLSQSIRWIKSNMRGSIQQLGYGTGMTTSEFITLLTTLGAFNFGSSTYRGTWSYAGNSYITDSGFGNIHLAGAVVEVFGTSSLFTIRITTSNTSNVANAKVKSEFIYNNNGAGYSAGWRILWNSENGGTGSGLDADLLDGNHASAFSLTTHNHTLASLSEKSYNSLTDKPTIPAAQVQTDWDATTGLGVLLNKPASLPANGGNADTLEGLSSSAFAKIGTAFTSFGNIAGNNADCAVFVIDTSSRWISNAIHEILANNITLPSGTSSMVLILQPGIYEIVGGIDFASYNVRAIIGLCPDSTIINVEDTTGPIMNLELIENLTINIEGSTAGNILANSSLSKAEAHNLKIKYTGSLGYDAEITCFSEYTNITNCAIEGIIGIAFKSRNITNVKHTCLNINNYNGLAALTKTQNVSNFSGLYSLPIAVGGDSINLSNFLIEFSTADDQLRTCFKGCVDLSNIRILNCDIGFGSCGNISNAIVETDTSNTATVAYSNCNLLSNCKAVAYVGFGGCNKIVSSEALSCNIGFYSSSKISVSRAVGCTLYGFDSCSGLVQNSSDNYNSCFADSNASYAVADTPGGGFNS